MLYTIVFISKQQLRDIKLEGILNPDFITDKYIHEGQFEYSVKIQQSYLEVLSSKHYNTRSILNCTKWKTPRGAEAALLKVKSALSENKKTRVWGDNNNWAKNKGEYVPVICNITEEWNKKIQSQIDKEIVDHQKRINTLKKKLA